MQRLSFFARQWQDKRRDERRSFWLILRMHFAAVSLHDGANAIQAKTIMAVTDFSKRFASPIFGG